MGWLDDKWSEANTFVSWILNISLGHNKYKNILHNMFPRNIQQQKLGVITYSNASLLFCGRWEMHCSVQLQKQVLFGRKMKECKMFFQQFTCWTCFKLKGNLKTFTIMNRYGYFLKRTEFPWILCTWRRAKIPSIYD